MRFRTILKREPRHSAGFSSKLALVRVLSRLLTGLLRLLRLHRLLSGLLALLLTRLISLAALLRLALVVIVHVNLQKFAEV
jgi:hypothetical protein